MNKNEVIAKLQKAVLSHKKWVANARALIEGVPLEKDKVPVNPTECAFGQWYYSFGQNLREVPGFNAIEESHNNLHKTYMEIFAILFGEGSEPSFFSRLIGRSHKIIAANREEAMKKYSTLEQQSKQITNQLAQLEKIITAMSDKQFEKYSPQD
ncbi:MAG: CZB domain-containing protein [Candidatus Electrothrix scaldis]|nr:MAG: CZB domain-containing protein [Candidatus Electrothrix sp. GW3-3]